jgi:hypothetical protein
MPPPLILLRTPLQLQTRRRNQIANSLNREPVTEGYKKAVDDLRNKYPRARHRPVGPTWQYNCHGLTFAARRTWIQDPKEINKIIEDDEYKKVSFNEVMAGDVAIYFMNGDAEHSGQVIHKESYSVWILSKWGNCQEAIHLVGDYEYDASDVRYYRMEK